MSINNVTSVRSDIAEMLAKMRDISTKSKIFDEKSNVNPLNFEGKVNGFDNTLSLVKNAFDTVNNVQAQSEQIKTAYLSGDTSVSMAQVVMASQKSKLAFEGLITVRNKLLDAYKEIMNMGV